MFHIWSLRCNISLYPSKIYRFVKACLHGLNPIPIFAWCYTCHFFKQFGEILRVRYADQYADLTALKICIAEQGLGTLKTNFGNIINDPFAHFPLKQIGEVIFTKMNMLA